MKLSNIKIRKPYFYHPPCEEKMEKCRQYYKEHGVLDRDIVLTKNNYLADGYVGYLVLLENGVEETEVVKPKKQTTYVYGCHPGDITKTEYIWRVTKRTKYAENIQVGSKVVVYTKNGTRVVNVTRLETLESPPLNRTIRKVAKCLKT